MGWLLDGFDVMLYAFAIPAIKNEFGLTLSQAGILASVTLLASSIGGIVAGALADRFGRARVLVYSILVYSVFTALTGFATSLSFLLTTRTLVGLGLGGEWSAGSVLVAETWPARHRGKAIGLMQAGWAIGYILAAIAAGIFLPQGHWRILFFIGVFPALATFWIRRHVPEPELWRRHESQFIARFRSDRVLRKRVVLGTSLATACLFAYWGLFTWIPSYLSLPKASGGAGLTVLNSVEWIIPMEIGAFFGYATFGFLADRFGRRSTFFVFVLLSAVITPLYGKLGNFPEFLLLLGPFVGFLGHGYFSLFGALL
jgi:MFS family permease